MKLGWKFGTGFADSRAIFRKFGTGFRSSGQTADLWGGRREMGEKKKRERKERKLRVIGERRRKKQSPPRCIDRHFEARAEDAFPVDRNTGPDASEVINPVNKLFL